MRVLFLSRAVPRLVDGFDVDNSPAALKHHQHHHHHHHSHTNSAQNDSSIFDVLAHQHQAQHPPTRLWHLLSTCLSEHGRQQLVKRLGFSPLTPTGTYHLHLGDPQERQMVVHLIAMARTMSMEWARRYE